MVLWYPEVALVGGRKGPNGMNGAEEMVKPPSTLLEALKDGETKVKHV